MTNQPVTQQADGPGTGRENGDAQPGAGTTPRAQSAQAPVLLSTTPAWLNWAAVTLAVMIVAGVFLLSARQLSAPQDGVSAGQIERIQAGVGGMELDTDDSAAAAGSVSAESSAAASAQLSQLAPGDILVNAEGAVELYAEPQQETVFLDSYPPGGTFVVVEPSGDFHAYPVQVEDREWVRVRAADGLVGWTPAADMGIGP